LDTSAVRRDWRLRGDMALRRWRRLGPILLTFALALLAGAAAESPSPHPERRRAGRGGMSGRLGWMARLLAFIAARRLMKEAKASERGLQARNRRPAKRTCGADLTLSACAASLRSSPDLLAPPALVVAKIVRTSRVKRDSMAIHRQAAVLWPGSCQHCRMTKLTSFASAHR